MALVPASQPAQVSTPLRSKLFAYKGRLGTKTTTFIVLLQTRS